VHPAKPANRRAAAIWQKRVKVIIAFYTSR